MSRAGRIVLGLALAGAGAAAADVLNGTPDVAAGGGARATIDAWVACAAAKPVPPDCGAKRTAAVELLVADLRTLGSSGNSRPLPLLVRALKSPEPELRVASLDGIGMIGPSPAETAALASAFNDPVPAVRLAAQSALGASHDEAARKLATRAVHAERWKGLAAEKAPDTTKLHIATYAGATPLRFGIDLADGRALFVADDPPEKVVAFYNAKAKRKAMSLEEFTAAYGAPQEESSGDDTGDDSADDSGDGQPSEADMEKQMERAMAMLDQMNAAIDSGKSMEEAAAEMGGAGVKADSAADVYADESVYGAPQVIVLEEGAAYGKANPTRYVVVYRDLTLGKTGIALHAPPVI